MLEERANSSALVEQAALEIGSAAPCVEFWASRTSSFEWKTVMRSLAVSVYQVEAERRDCQYGGILDMHVVLQ